MDRLTRTAVVLLSVGALTGCTAGAGSPSSSSATVGASDAPRTAGGGSGSELPQGFFGLPSVTGADPRYDFTVATDCDTAAQIVNTGQWRVEPVLAGEEGVSVSVFALSLEGRSALLTLDPVGDTCSGDILLPSEQPLTLTGSATTDGPAQFLPYQCDHNDLSDDQVVSLTGLYDSASAHLIAHIGFTAGKGDQDLAGDDVELDVLTGDEPSLVTMGRLWAAGMSGDESAAVDMGHGYYAGDEFRGTVHVTGTEPLEGTAELHGLVDGDTGAPLDASFGFRCT